LGYDAEHLAGITKLRLGRKLLLVKIIISKNQSF